MLKRIFSIFAITLILTGCFFQSYSLKCPVFADDTTDSWLNVTTNEQLVEAFKYYCKSRDLTIEGSVADAVTSFTTKTFNGICNTLGIDITALQSQLKYQTDGNLGLRFLFTSSGIDAYNRIFSQFLQDNELSVGDAVNNKSLYDGYTYNGNLIYIFSKNETVGTKYYSVDSAIVTVGTIYPHDANYYISQYNGSSSSLTFPVILPDGTFNNVVYYSGMGGNYESIFANNTSSTYGGYYWRKNYSYTSLGDCLFYNQYNQTLHYGVVGKVGTTYYFMSQHAISTGNVSNDATITNIYLTTNNKTINNNNYEGDTIINNEGDIINNYPDNPDNPDLPPSNPTVPDSGGWQDFQLPTMPNDWLIYGMEKKFPFDIPFNIMFGLSLLNHEPEIPKFEGDIDLKVCTWHYDIDLTPFDDIAKILRKFEVLAFIIGLAMLTKELIMWG